jgi:hypothetical protein
MRPIHFLLLVSVLSCSDGKTQDSVSVRFKNETDEDFKTLYVNIIGHEFTFINIKKGDQTKSVNVPASYRYCYARATTSKDTLICQPEDFVGETLYKKGNLLMTLFVFPGDSMINKKRYIGIR